MSTKASSSRSAREQSEAKNASAVASNALAIHPDRISQVQVSTIPIPGFQLAEARTPVSTNSPLVVRQAEGIPVNIAHSNPSKMDENASEDSESLLDNVFREMTEEAAKLGDLKGRLERARKVVAHRIAESKLMEKHFPKYPDVKEQALVATRDAEKKVQNLETQVTRQELIFLRVTNKTAKESLPAITTQMQQAGGVLERKVDQLTEIFKQQQAIISQLQKDKEETTSQFQKDKEDIKLQLQKAKELSSSSEERYVAAIHSLKVPIQKALQLQQQKIDLATSQIRSDVTTFRTDVDNRLNLANEKSEKQKEDLKTLSNRTSDVGKIKEDVQKLAVSSSRTADLHKKVDLILLPKKVDPQAEMERSIKEMQSSLNEIQTKLKSSEGVIPRPSPVVATKKDLQALQGRLRSIETTPPPKTAQLSDSATSSLLGRLETMERQLGEFTKSVGTFTDESGLTGSIVQNITDLRDQIENVEATSEVLQTLISSAVMEGAKTIEKNLTQELKRYVDTELVAIKQDIDAVRSGLPPIKDIDALQKAQDHINGCLNTFPKYKIDQNIDTLQKAQADLTGRFNTLQETTNVFESRMATNIQSRVNEIVIKVTDTVRGNLLRVFTDMQNNLGLKQLNDEVVGLKHETSDLNHKFDHLASRVDNISTAELAQNMIGQVGAVFPNLTDHGNTIRNLQGYVANLEDRVSKLANEPRGSNNNVEVEALQKQLLEVEVKMNGLGTAIKQMHSTEIEALQKQTLVFEEKIGGLDAAVKEIVASETAELRVEVAKSMKDNTDAISGWVVESDKEMHDSLKAAKDETGKLLEEAKAATTYVGKRVDELVADKTNTAALSRTFVDLLEKVTNLSKNVASHDEQLSKLNPSPSHSSSSGSMQTQGSSPVVRLPQASQLAAGTPLRNESNGHFPKVFGSSYPTRPDLKIKGAASPINPPKRQLSSTASMNSDPPYKPHKRKHPATDTSQLSSHEYGRMKKKRAPRQWVKNSSDDDVEVASDGGEDIIA